MVCCKSFVNSIINWDRTCKAKRINDSNFVLATVIYIRSDLKIVNSYLFEECILLTLEILNQILNTAKVDDGNF